MITINKKALGYIASFKETIKDKNSIIVSFKTICSTDKSECLKYKNNKDFDFTTIYEGDCTNILTSVDTIDLSNYEILDIWKYRYKTLHNKEISEDFYFTFHLLNNWMFDNLQKINVKEIRMEHFLSIFPKLSKQDIEKYIDIIEDFEEAIYEKELADF